MANQLMLHPGDIFCVAPESQGVLSKAIIKVSKAKSLDGQCRYSHTGIMMSQVRTFEANWHYEQKHIYDEYEGCDILIGRLNIKADWSRGLQKYQYLLGRQYPWYRLPGFLLGTARYLYAGKPVCSELTVGIAYEASRYEPFKRNLGWVPDDVADAIHYWDVFDVVYEGPLPKHLNPLKNTQPDQYGDAGI